MGVGRGILTERRLCTIISEDEEGVLPAPEQALRRSGIVNMEYKWKIFYITGIANLVCAYAVNSINLALPVLAEEFGTDVGGVSWLSLVYAVVPTCTLLLFGRLADLKGYRNQFILGFLFFGAVSLLLPLLSKTLPVLIFFRSLQGLGYSMIISITQGMVSRTFPPEERGMALGINTVFVSVGLAAGPSVGGILLSAFDWQAMFYIAVPFCLLGALLTWKIMKDDRPTQAGTEQAGAERGEASMDWAGAAFFAVFVGALIVAVNRGGDWGVLSPAFSACLILSAAALTGFILRERSAEAPMMQLALFRSRGFTLSNITSMLSYMSQQLTTFLTPFFLINVLSLQESVSGMVMLATPLTMMACSAAGGRMKDKFGFQLPAGLGLLIIAMGCFLMSRLSAGSSTAYVAGCLICFGVGNGLSVPAVNASIFDFVPREHSGAASGMVATMRNLGQALGVAFAGAVIAMRQPVYLAGGLSGTAAYLPAQRDAFYFGIFVAFSALLCVYSTKERGRNRRT